MSQNHRINLSEKSEGRWKKFRRFMRQEKIGHIQQVVLGTIGLAGLITVAMVAPNALQAFAKLGLIPGKRKKERIQQSYRILLKHGFLEKDENDFVRITEKGEARLKEFEIINKRFSLKQKWDGRWRILIFDIPEKKRVLRDGIRKTLTATGFKHLQHSVWIYPYDCKDTVSLLKKDFEIGKDLIYIITEKIEYDETLRKHFDLES
ncbi:MAG: hypothetical protein A3G59_02625 [Candidatus Taylorbacteria bacterium RIFCSPLOWO2_12_FULL_47_20]|uniref:Transcriptional repressor PaaX-like central Cas2-like domain-containing protein n=2 Tax=Candidatus Tayloriibacteriota TaxID=1817919 RepID=A0A1G2P9L4_9BACT|nr:MAG: hypothetical protein A3H68_01465 [Candidatus Taylorbacteria bacterium RIFCSPLOWO2_02_FULL_46_40]OHA44291.1 MAG: hypothetical protein A3G59_02625 [Candidatus Taylorbacteria bacterium RIFCSPLOWO2_12_FULL_47_20]